MFDVRTLDETTAGADDRCGSTFGSCTGVFAATSVAGPAELSGSAVGCHVVRP